MVLPQARMLPGDRAAAAEPHGLGEQLRLRRAKGWGRDQADVAVGKLGRNPPSRGAGQEAELDEVGLEDVFDGFSLLRDRDRQGVDAHRAPAVLLDDGGNDAPAHLVETSLSDTERLHRAYPGAAIGDPPSLHL